MTLLRKSFSAIFMSMCKGHMSLFMSLDNSVPLFTKAINVKLLMTITTNTANNASEMTPSPPSPTLSDNPTLLSSPDNTLETSTETIYDLNNINLNNKSDLIQLGKEFNKFYFTGK